MQKSYVFEGMETRYLLGTVDLNGDGDPEVFVHVVGPGACGTGGCPTLVFTPSDSGYRLVSTISVSRPPIRAAAAASHGWRNLIVQIAGGGGKAGDVELAFDGKSYPQNPTVRGRRLAAASEAEVVIRDFASFADATPLAPAPPR